MVSVTPNLSFRTECNVDFLKEKKNAKNQPALMNITKTCYMMYKTWKLEKGNDSHDVSVYLFFLCFISIFYKIQIKTKWKKNLNNYQIRWTLFAGVSMSGMTFGWDVLIFPSATAAGKQLTPPHRKPVTVSVFVI